MSDGLMPCPFCGGHGEQLSISKFKHTVEYDSFMVVCEFCSTEGPIAINRNGAATKWNTRNGSGDGDGYG